MVKNPPANTGAAGDTGLNPGSGRSPGGGNGHPLQYSCQDNPMDRGAWQAAVHGVEESDFFKLKSHTTEVTEQGTTLNIQRWISAHVRAC